MSGKRVFVGNIPNDSREGDLVKFFKGYGHIREVVVKNIPDVMEKPSYGFVEFEDSRDAKDVTYDLDGKDLRGNRVRVELARDPRDKFINRDRRASSNGRFRGGGDRSSHGGRYSRGNPPGPRSDYRLKVENLSDNTSWQDLKEEEMESNDKNEVVATKETNSCKDDLTEKLTNKNQPESVMKINQLAVVPDREKIDSSKDELTRNNQMNVDSEINNQPDVVPETKRVIENLINDQIKAMIDKASMRAEDPNTLKALIENATMKTEKSNDSIESDASTLIDQSTKTKLEDPSSVVSEMNKTKDDLVEDPINIAIDKTIKKADDLITWIKTEQFKFQGFKRCHGNLLFTSEQLADYTYHVIERTMELDCSDPQIIWKEFSKYFM